MASAEARSCTEDDIDLREEGGGEEGRGKGGREEIYTENKRGEGEGKREVRGKESM